MIVRLPLESISLEFQDSDCLDFEKCHEYMETVRAGRPLLPVHVYYDGHTYRLFDGFHRIAALRELGSTEVEAEITEGSREDMEARFREGLADIRKDLRKPAAEG
ncbi:MAG TPA: hypothetical protein VGK64_12625 [Bryobacteraceae bacterium]